VLKGKVSRYPRIVLDPNRITIFSDLGELPLLANGFMHGVSGLD